MTHKPNPSLTETKDKPIFALEIYERHGRCRVLCKSKEIERGNSPAMSIGISSMDLPHVIQPKRLLSAITILDPCQPIIMTLLFSVSPHNPVFLSHWSI